MVSQIKHNSMDSMSLLRYPFNNVSRSLSLLLSNLLHLDGFSELSAECQVSLQHRYSTSQAASTCDTED